MLWRSTAEGHPVEVVHVSHEIKYIFECIFTEITLHLKQIVLASKGEKEFTTNIMVLEENRY